MIFVQHKQLDHWLLDKNWIWKTISYNFLSNFGTEQSNTHKFITDLTTVIYENMQHTIKWVLLHDIFTLMIIIYTVTSMSTLGRIILLCM